MNTKNLYILKNDASLIKIGIADSTYHRLETLNREYQNPFEIVCSFSTNEEATGSIEKFLHQLFNISLLNVEFMAKELNIIELDKYINKKDSGHLAQGRTEIFFSDNSLLANSLFILNSLGLIKMEEKDIQAIKEIKQFPIDKLLDMQKERLKTRLSYTNYNKIKNKTSISKGIISTHLIHEKNFSNFIKTNQEILSTVSLKENEELQMFINGKSISINTFLHGNKDIDLLRKGLGFSQDNKEEINIKKFYEYVKKIGKENKQISVQKIGIPNSHSEEKIKQRREREEKFLAYRREAENIIKEIAPKKEQIRTMIDLCLSNMVLDTDYLGGGIPSESKAIRELLDKCLNNIFYKNVYPNIWTFDALSHNDIKIKNHFIKSTHYFRETNKDARKIIEIIELMQETKGSCPGATYWPAGELSRLKKLGLRCDNILSNLQKIKNSIDEPPQCQSNKAKL